LCLSQAELDNIFAGTINIGDTITGTITISADIQHANDANFVVTTGRNIVFNSGTGWTSDAGNLTFSANQQATPTSGNFTGIDVNHATISSTSGAITLQGRGGKAGGFDYGVFVHNGAIVGSGTSGAVTVSGTGGASTGNYNYGVYVIDSGSQVTSGGSNVAVTGQGGGAGAS